VAKAMWGMVTKKTTSFVLISLVLVAIFAGAMCGVGIGGAGEEINIQLNAALPTPFLKHLQIPFQHNNNSLSPRIGDFMSDDELSSTTSSTTVTLTPVADATIDYISPNTNFGTQDTLEVQYQSSRQVRRTLLRFNLAAAVPPEAIIDLARLDLYLEGLHDPAKFFSSRFVWPGKGLFD